MFLKRVSACQCDQGVIEIQFLGIDLVNCLRRLNALQLIIKFDETFDVLLIGGACSVAVCSRVQVRRGVAVRSRRRADTAANVMSR